MRVEQLVKNLKNKIYILLGFDPVVEEEEKELVPVRVYE